LEGFHHFGTAVAQGVEREKRKIKKAERVEKKFGAPSLIVSYLKL
jgi:hypothetical protein